MYTVYPQITPVVAFEQYRVSEKLRYECDCVDLIIEVPAGFMTDGASIPRTLWSVVGHPFEADTIRAAVIHDFLYSQHGTGKTYIDRSTADQIFYEVLKKDQKRRICSWYKRMKGQLKIRSFYAGVRVGGAGRWND